MHWVYFTLLIPYHFILEYMGRKFISFIHFYIPVMKDSVQCVAAIQLIVGEWKNEQISLIPYDLPFRWSQV